MGSFPPSKTIMPLQRSRLLLSIRRQEDIIREAENEAENEAEKIETDMSYKEGQINDLKFERIAHNGLTTTFDRDIKRAKAECEQIHDVLDNKKEETAVFKDKLKRREAKLAAIPRVMFADAPSPEDDKEVTARLEITSTQTNQVFAISDDGKTYINPAMLRGVPIEPIDEDDGYWEMTWIKFKDAIDEDQIEREYQQELDAWRQRAREETPSAEDEDSEKEFKRYQRNLNQAKVIKKWFRPGNTVHPNQIMAKHHLPDTGLCIVHVLYKICNILVRLSALHERGELGMPPLYFLMWRMSVSLDRQPRTHMKTFWRVIIDEDHIAYDEVLRKAEIRGAQHVGDYNFYNRRWKKVVSAKGQRQQTAASPSATKTAVQTPGQSMTPSRKSRDQLHQSTPTTIGTSAVDPTGSPKTTLTTTESPATQELRHQPKKRRSSATLEQQASEGGNGAPSARKARKVARKRMQLALRSRSSTESLALNRPEISTYARNTKFNTKPPVSQGERKTPATVDKLPQNDNPSSATGRDAQAWVKHVEEVQRRACAQKTETALEDATSYVVTVGEDKDRAIENGSGAMDVRAAVRESPFPKTGKKVSHGFIFPWYCCEAARKADETW
ncbi:acyl- thioesterase ii [Colletotrichum incanum]|uniref:Acyl-thioesterase ii n=1 Tax=Colletotrichum incanum TaxID=1573173 RepID=A0A167D522_COLIC|nr:acyl- thioesterase ii [Colletotrichum incanum]